VVVIFLWVFFNGFVVDELFKYLLDGVACFKPVHCDFVGLYVFSRW